MKKRIFPIAILAITFAVIFISGRKHTYTRTTYNAFDTVCTVSIYSASDYTKEYTDFLENLSARLSAYDENSEIYTLNKNGFSQLSSDTEALLCTAVSYSNFFPDLFDITVNPLCVLWENFKENGEIGDISSARSLIGCDGLFIDTSSHTAKITKDGASVTLGAIAKGYAADAVADMMRKDGVTSAIINLGGNIYVLGKKPDNSDRKIGIADPENPSDTIAALSISDLAVVTSGDYQRYFELGGKRYHHIIDPATGFPAESGLHSATAVGKSAQLCDVLSTVMFVGGADKAAELCAEYGIEAVLVSDDTIYCTAELIKNIELTSEKYTLQQL